ncbi:hypothetical protein Cfor_08402 [Coptotermes formosanus]|uniref:FYVE-type domain-containing protein n=1 Tax=Coptotermes formosanus TaxID=36987 RepID=A0A6L2Q3H0_COPFO|nr:hypothetical protein Cfor_08402 [Coptotermes formosanus]
MFNIKNIVNKITDRGRDSQPNSPGRGNGEDMLNKQAAEGFLCPKCMKAFPSPEELKSHYMSSHDGDGEGAILDLPATSNALSFLSLHQEVGERYKRQFAAFIVAAITDPTELKRRLIEALDNGVLLQKEKEQLEQRAAQLARDNATLKAASDEVEGTQATLRERLKLVEAQLAHRESIDDAAVLRQELVQVQRVMDELTREKERERDQLKTELKELQDLYAARELTNNSNEETHSAESQRRLDELGSMLRTRDSFITELQNNIDIYRKELNEAETKLQQELPRTQALEKELQVLRNKVTEVVEESQRKADDFLRCQNECVEVKQERDQLQKLQQNVANEINILIQQVEETKVKFEVTRKELEEREEALKSAQSCIESVNKQKDILKSELTHKSKVCEDYERSNTSLNEKIKEAEKSLLHQKEEISRMESERTELLVKIEAGEGANTAIQQLSQEKTLLSNELKKQKEYHTTYEKEMSAKLEDATTQARELEKKNEDILLKVSDYENRIGTLCTEVQESQKEVKKLTDDQNEKESALQALHSSKNQLQSEKDACERRITDLRYLLDEKSSQLTEYSEKIAAMTDNLQRIEKRSSELEIENKSLEGSLREQTTVVDHLQTDLTARELKLRDTISQVSDLCAEVEMKTANGLELKAENAKLATENSLLKENVKDKEEELQVLVVQRAALETSLFELTAGVEEDKRQIEDKWKKEVEDIKSLFECSQVMVSELEEGNKLLLDQKAELKQQIATLEGDLVEAKQNAHEKQTTLNHKLSAVTASKETTEEELAAEKHKLIELKKNNEVMKEAYEEEIENKNKELKDVCASLDDIAGEKLALEAQLAASQSEQQALLERCYASSSESENLRKTITDLRRQLEESQAALHELGRENQTLQLELEKLLGRKWTEDSDAISCSLCQKEFSLIVRKHHCRNCGQIFCNECSSKMAPIASNKKPVRVCDSCYNELGSK